MRYVAICYNMLSHKRSYMLSHDQEGEDLDRFIKRVAKQYTQKDGWCVNFGEYSDVDFY